MERINGYDAMTSGNVFSPKLVQQELEIVASYGVSRTYAKNTILVILVFGEPTH